MEPHATVGLEFAGAWEPELWAGPCGYGLHPRFGLWLGSWRGPAGEEGPIMGPVPQGLLVQGAVEAVDFLLAVFLDGVKGGPAAHHLQHVAMGSRGSKGLSGDLPHLYHPLFSAPPPTPVPCPQPTPVSRWLGPPFTCPENCQNRPSPNLGSRRMGRRLWGRRGGGREEK